MHVCVVDHQGQKQLHRNVNTKEIERFLGAMQPFEQRDLVIGCESTYNWYWLADLCHERNLSFLLGHALYLKTIHGGKTKSDRIDSDKLVSRATQLFGIDVAGGEVASAEEHGCTRIHIPISSTAGSPIDAPGLSPP